MVRGIELFFSLFNNLALFIALVTLYGYLIRKFMVSLWFRRQALLGLTFGVFAIGCMHAKIPVFEGVIVDQRNAIVALSGAFGGPLSAVISAFFAGLYRIYLGGGGALAGVIGVTLSGCSGIILNRFSGCFSSFKNAMISAFTATIIILPGFLFVRDLDTGWKLMKAMSLPYGLAIFSGILLVGLLLKKEEERFSFELSFRESERKYRELIEGTIDLIIHTDKHGIVTFANHVAEKIWGLTPEKCIGKSAFDFIHPDDLTLTAALFNKNAAENNEEFKIENRQINVETDETLTVLWAFSLYYDSSGLFAGMGGIARDITELKQKERSLRENRKNLEKEIVHRKSIEKALRKNEERLDLALSAAKEGLWDWKLDSNTLHLDSRYYRISGYKPDEFPAAFEEWEKRVHPEDIEHAKLSIEKYLSGKTDKFDVEFRFLKKSGEYMWIQAKGKIADRDYEGKPARFIGTHSDITERKQTEKEMDKLRNYLSNIINSMPSILVGVDKEGRITQWNSTAERATGVSAEAAAGRILNDAFPRFAGKFEYAKKTIVTRQVTTVPRQTRIENNQTFYEDVTIYPLVTNCVEGAVIIVDDITEQVQLEEMMIQSEKMLSVGGLAAGMAHEINNPLAGMIQTAYVLKKRLDDADLKANKKAAEEIGVSLEKIQAYMKKRNIFRMTDAISDSGRRVSEIVSNMLSFARKTDSIVSTYAVDQLLDQTLELAATNYDLKKKYDFKSIKIVRKYEDSLPVIPCEGAKIQQVFLNILRNGAHAMCSDGQSQDSAPCFTLRLSVEKTKEMLRIEIEDNGPGIDEAAQKRIFEPFYTTKPVGIGTGLGLSVSYFIIAENHKGTMDVESAPGKGANFIIRLPLNQRK